MLKQLVTFLAEAFARLFNNPLVIAVVPSDKRAVIIYPIFNKGGTEDVVNYHPKSLTSFCV